MQQEKTFDNSKVSSNSTQLQILKKNFPQCFDRGGNFIARKMQEIVAKDDISLSKESYSLNWLGKSYARLLANETPLSLLREGTEHNQKPQNQNSENILIKGDNLEVLKHLRHAYSESVKMIYIDPPYNTGSDDFVYADKRKYTIEQLQRLAGIDEDEAQRILDFTNSNSNSHSAWLTFIYPRLYIARELLSDDGVIFISIDDNEVSQLSLLISEVFGEENIDTMIWRKSGSGRDGKMKNTTKFRIDHEYILVGFKKELFLNKSFEKPNWENSYPNPDNDKRGNYKPGSISNREESSNPHHPNNYTVTSPVGTEFTRQFNVAEHEFKSLNDDGRIYWGKNQKAVPAIKIFENEKRLVTTSSLINYKNITTTAGSKELESIIPINDLGRNLRPKPTPLLEKLLIIGSNKDSLVVDFFSGSGTTADAVMQLNAEDSGNRKCISVQLDEPIDPKKNKAAYDFVKDKLGKANPTIFDITKERILRAGAKIQEDNKASKEPKDLSKQDFGFKVFETLPMFEGFLDDVEELYHEQQVMPFDDSKLSDSDLQVLLTTWMVNDGIKLTAKVAKVTLDKYIAYYADKSLYLMDKGFTTDDLKALLVKLDGTDDFQPNRLVLFGYNFESKHQREISEALNSYTNKKQIELDRIIRY